MSHIVLQAARIRDLDIAAEALDRLGADLLRGQTTFRSFQTGRCDHAIRVRGVSAYEAGLVPNADGDGYQIAMDDYGSQGQALVNKLGPGLEYFQNEYLAVTDERFLRSEGYMLSREVLGDEIVLVAQR
jgi:hypothetical protein